MRAVRVGPEGLTVEALQVPRPQGGEALVRVHAAAITRDKLIWPVERLPAIPSYELRARQVRLGAVPGTSSLRRGSGQ